MFSKITRGLFTRKTSFFVMTPLSHLVGSTRPDRLSRGPDWALRPVERVQLRRRHRLAIVRVLGARGSRMRVSRVHAVELEPNPAVQIGIMHGACRGSAGAARRAQRLRSVSPAGGVPASFRPWSAPAGTG